MKQNGLPSGLDGKEHDAITVTRAMRITKPQMLWISRERFESKTYKFFMMYNLTSPVESKGFNKIAFFPLE